MILPQKLSFLAYLILLDITYQDINICKGSLALSCLSGITSSVFASSSWLVIMTAPFWKEKTLDEMTDLEWESLCDGCGKCCLHKYIDDETDELYFTNIACNLLDLNTCSCKDYANRLRLDEGCSELRRDQIQNLHWMPETCAYRLIDQGKPLPKWHPLMTGSKKAMHVAGQSAQGNIVYQIDVVNWEDHITNKPKNA